MRRKFFLIVLALLLVSIFVVSTLQFLFFDRERLSLVDQRLETIASSLIASGLSLSMIQNLESTDDLISDLLGEERVDSIINIYSLEGEVLAQNYTATAIPLEFNRDEVHQSYDVGGKPVRALNIKKGHLVVQVGIVLGPGSLNRMVFVNTDFFFFSLFVLALLTAAAYFSSLILFTPLRRLTIELQAMSAQLERKLGQPLSGFVIGPNLARLARRPDSKDEFEKLCAEIESFLKKLEGYTRSFHAQTAILTHELKTPLTILRNYLDELRRAKDMAKARELGVSALAEIDRLTRLINDFLQWSVLTTNPGQPNEIYAVKLSEIVGKCVSDLNLVHKGRIQFENEGEVLVFALPDHVRQLVSNLLSNALNYSPESRTVHCRVRTDVLEVQDQGSGIPLDVQQHLGSPFNRSEQRAAGGTGVSGGTAARADKGSGLGLAWVHSLCEKYGWKLVLETGAQGTFVRVEFP